MKNFFKTFWGGFIIAFTLCFIVSYITWPKIPLDKELIEGTKVILPKPGDTEGISFPQDGDVIEDVFIVYGLGQAFENQAMLELVDSSDRLLLSTPVYFNSPDIGITGPFITALDLTYVSPETETGKIILYEEDAATGGKIIIDDVNVRF